jgi:uncharacterized protein YjbI with pentapeptide repeats
MLHRSNKTAGAKRGLIETSAYDALLPYVADPDEPPRYALHFGTVDKVGVNPRSEYDTPLAVCAYPLTEEIFEQFLKIDLPFAQKEAKHLYLLEIRPDARVFYSTPQFFKQGVGPEYVGTARKSEKFFYSTRPEDYEDRPMYASEEHQTVARAAQWGRKLMDMGIAVWVDADNEGILHEGEPSQVMFFSPLSYSIVFSMDNPKDRFVARYGRDWRKRKDVRGMDLSRADLSDMNLRGANLTDVNLTGAHLDRVRYDDSTIWPDSVRDVLRVWRGDKNLIRANLTGANLRSADLTGANLTGADLTDAILTYAILTGAILTDAILTFAKLTGAFLTDAILPDAILSGADLSNANLPGANLTRADLTGADLFGADLIGADLIGADLTRADLTRAYLRDVKYDDSTVWPDSVRDVLRVWRGDKDLTRAVLHGADLTGANLTGANLTRAVLTRADLTGAILIGAYLSRAVLSGTILEGITYDETTTWPDGFTPPPSTPRPNRRR